MKPKKIILPRPKIGGLEYFGILVDEIHGTRKQLNELTNIEKEKIFRSVFDDVKSWKKRVSNLDGCGNLSERTGIYISLYSLWLCGDYFDYIFLESLIITTPFLNILWDFSLFKS